MHIRGNVIFFVMLAAAVALLAARFDALLSISSAAPLQKLDKLTTLTKKISWKPDETVEPGTYTLTLVATDDHGATTTRDITIEVIAETEGIDNVQVIPERNRATITWATQQAVFPHVDFDINELFRRQRSRSEGGRQKQHSTVLENLLACTTYTFRVQAKGLAQNILGTPRVFTTTGCSGDAKVTGYAKDDISAAQGGGLSLGDKITVHVPAEATAQDAHFQIHQLARDEALAVISTPQEDLTPITGLYELSAYTNPETSVSSFNQPLQVTVAYTPTPDSDLSTLALYRHDGTRWTKLEHCTVDEDSQTVTCATNQFSAVAGFVLGTTSSPDEEPEPEPVSSSNNSDEGSGNESAPPAPVRTHTYQAETAHTITGTYSGITGQIVKLAGSHDILSKRVHVAPDDYWLDVRVKHDRPGPVRMAVYVNNRAWKIITLDKADDLYRTHRIGMLRGFSNATIHFRMINDTYDKGDPTNEATDRNLWIDWWRLTTSDHLPTGATARSHNQVAGNARSLGWRLLPQLNQVMRQENIPVTVDNWLYYAWRLTVPTTNRAAIQTEEHLRTVMRFWQSVNPQQPRGERL